MAATPDQIKDLAQTIANQAQAIADGKVGAGELFAHVARLHNNTNGGSH